jgi:hypothetical protein
MDAGRSQGPHAEATSGIAVVRRLQIQRNPFPCRHVSVRRVEQGQSLAAGAI